MLAHLKDAFTAPPPPPAPLPLSLPAHYPLHSVPRTSLTMTPLAPWSQPASGESQTEVRALATLPDLGKAVWPTPRFRSRHRPSMGCVGSFFPAAARERMGSPLAPSAWRLVGTFTFTTWTHRTATPFLSSCRARPAGYRRPLPAWLQAWRRDIMQSRLFLDQRGALDFLVAGARPPAGVAHTLGRSPWAFPTKPQGCAHSACSGHSVYKPAPDQEGLILRNVLACDATSPAVSHLPVTWSEWAQLPLRCAAFPVSV